MTHEDAVRIVIAVTRDWLATVTDEYLEDFNLDDCDKTKEHVEEALGILIELGANTATIWRRWSN